MEKKNKLGIIVLLGLGLLCILGVFINGNLFGSNIDWINQHVAFPDYFRNLFYETGNLFPQIAWNLGLGQNIYHFAYYGFLNPIILLSYLFPFIKMTTYIMISSGVLYLFSIYLFYKWIEPKYEGKTCFLLSLLFLLAGPIFFHFHRQLMFVNYFPFLLLSLIIIDHNKKYCFVQLSITIFLMIMCSYYYSIGCILVVFLYYLYKHYRVSWKEKSKIFFPILISVLLSGILTIPVLYTIFTSRSNVGEAINIWSLLLPNFEFDQILYGNYALGLTAITIPALVSSVMHKKKENKFLGISLFILILFPIFRYLLNGGLYIRSKALIPFLPLFILIIGNFLEDIFAKKIDYRKIAKVTLIVTAIGLFTGYYHFAYYIDLLVTLLLLYFCGRSHKQNGLYILLSLFSLVLFVGFQFTEDFVTYDRYEELHQYDILIEEQIEKDSSVYRFANLIDSIDTVNMVYHPRYYKNTVYSSTYNENYYDFYHNALNTNNDTYNHLMLVDTNNIISHRLFGSKYILSSEKLGWGYELLKKQNNIYLYNNQLALPLGYATSNMYSSEQFSNLSYPYNLEMLLTGVIVDSDKNNSYTSQIKEIDLTNLKMDLGDFISISNMENYSVLEVTKNSKITISLDEPVDEKILLIEIAGLERNSCNIEDIGMEINGISNTLSCDSWRYPNGNNTFHFLLNEDNLNEFVINIRQGSYKITDVSIYQMDRSILQYQFDEMKNLKIENNILTGDIRALEDGYMVLSIPYDKGFEIEVDGNKVTYEKVNTSFLGLSLNKGFHTIKVIYKAPGMCLGLISSLVGFIILLISFLINFVNNIFTKCKK